MSEHFWYILASALTLIPAGVRGNQARRMVRPDF